MALVQFGSGVAYMSGRVAGTVHARNKGGSYVRRMSIPVNAATSFQQNVRSSLGLNSALWSGLTAGQRAAWVAWASTHPVVNRLGAAILLSGHQAYVAINRNANSDGEAIGFFPDPPAEPTYEFPFEENFVVDADATGGTFTITQTVQPAADTEVFLYATPAVSPGVSFVKDKVKFLGPITVLSATAVPVDVDILALWEARFGDLTLSLIGKNIGITAITYSEGQLSVGRTSFGQVT